jgi:hypothetical protein
MDNVRHVIDRVFNPRFFIQMAYHDVAITVDQSVVSAFVDVASTVHLTLARGATYHPRHVSATGSRLSSVSANVLTIPAPWPGTAATPSGATSRLPPRPGTAVTNMAGGC